MDASDRGGWGVMIGKRNLRAAVLSVALLALLAGCGPMPDATPTATTTTAPATTTPEGEGAATPGTPESAVLTFGDIAERVGAAWPEVRSYRVSFTGTAPISPTGPGTPVARHLAMPGATPMARTRESYVTEREVVLPDRQRQRVTGLGGDDHEAIAIGDELFVQGPVVEQIAPGTPPETWIAIDPSTLPEGAMLLHILGGLPDPPGAPLATLPERLRSQTVRDLGTVEHDGRTCRVYGAADTIPATGMRVDYTIAIDDNDFPCFVETGAGGVTQGRDEYSDLDGPITIEPPVAATPVSVPPALATPIAHD